MKLNLIICGVGGQGNLLASVAVANYAMHKGLNVVGTETIGAAQRGGAVVSHLRIADGEIYSPVVPAGTADLLLGFEPVEALRHLGKISPGGAYVLNVEQIPTVLCKMGLDRYPPLGQITGALRGASSRGYTVNATETARRLGGEIMTNIVLLGVLSRVSDFFEKDDFRAVLERIVPPGKREINLQAFEEGYRLVNP